MRGTARAWRGAPFALSHHNALTVLGVPVHGVDDRVHLVRLDDGGRRGGRATSIHDTVPATFLTHHEDICVVVPPLAALQVAVTFGVEAGLVSADAVLRSDPHTSLAEVLDGVCLVRDADGFAARVDFLFREQRVIVEFDGMLKYASRKSSRRRRSGRTGCADWVIPSCA